MRNERHLMFLVAPALTLAATMLSLPGSAQERRDQPTGQHAPFYRDNAKQLLGLPVTGIYPGGIAFDDNVQNPFEGDPAALERGMKNFNAFNCSGCHAPNGAGGMGPALSNNKWLYRSKPANIYLSIYQGRAKGMPAWGRVLPSDAIWELVTYIQSISNDPDKGFGKTISKDPPAPSYEQVPVQEVMSPTPWRYTQPFHNGQKP